MKFKYMEYGDILRPVIPVVLSFKDRIVDCEVLIDSGSDKCFFDWEIGELIGINSTNSKLQEIIGVGGQKSFYYMHPVTLTVGDVSYEIEAGFIPKIGGGIVSYGIVGQKGFFDKFSVKFDLSIRTIEINPNKK